MSPEIRFEVFFKTHYSSLCNAVFRIVRDRDLSEDLVQEVFLKVWEKRGTLIMDDRFIHYLKKSCYHQALQLLNSQKNQSELNSKLAVFSGESDEELMENELQHNIREGLSTLPEKTRLIFSLSRYELMSNKDIAIQLEISIKAVEKHMTRALKHLKIYLKDFLFIILLSILQ